MDTTNQPHRKTVLITGASVGIGRELARVFARASYDLVLVARSTDKLEQVANELEKTYAVRVAAVARDLTEPGAPEEICDQLRKHNIGIDVLVNNAGMGTNGLFHMNDLKRELDMVQLNVTSLVHLTGLFLPNMVKARSGKILNVASTAAFQPGPLMAVYYASKAFVMSFSEAISHETQDCGVTVTALCPGPTETEFQRRAGMEHVKLATMGPMSAREVAIAGYQGLMEGKRVVIPGLKNRMLAFGAHTMPNRLVNKVVHSLNSNR